jgi:hypothetical protein
MLHSNKVKRITALNQRADSISNAKKNSYYFYQGWIKIQPARMGQLKPDKMSKTKTESMDQCNRILQVFRIRLFIPALPVEGDTNE